MFADISGFTAMSEKQDPEYVTSLMNDCFGIMGPIIEKYGGTIDKYIGDCIMVLFGAPAAIEDAPKRAVNTAIEIRNRLYQFNREKELSFPLDIHVGINTGLVIAGRMGSHEKKEYTVMGDTVNVASRLEEISPKGKIYVGPLTHTLTKNEFEYATLEPVSLKGKEAPIPVFELLSIKEKVHRAQLGTDRMIRSEMVGREQELDKLELHLSKVIKGEGSIVSVIGEPGIGKSRLIAELKGKDAINRVTLIEGRSLSIGKNLGYHPIIDMIKNWARIKGSDTQDESRHKLEKAISVIHPGRASEVFPFLATLLGMKIEGKHAERVKGIEGVALEKLIAKSLQEIITKAAQFRPVVFVLEDLHWADLTTIEFLESLYRLAQNNSILFINLFRSQYKETGERLLKTIREKYGDYYLEIVLEPLAEYQSEMLISNLIRIKKLSPHIRQLITKRTEGNPFFIEELVRSFIDEGVVVIRDGNFEVTERINSVVIPETIQDVLMARIDRLAMPIRQLLDNASVIGRYFFYRILSRVAEEIEDMDERLDYLKGVQLILESDRTKELEYLFKHALAQEVTYETILVKSRKELHLKVAAAIESLFSGRLQEFLGILSLHYSHGEDYAKAEEFLLRAGREALRSSASHEALNYFQEAFDLYMSKHGEEADPARVAELEKSIALAYYNKGQYEKAVRLFDRTLRYYGRGVPEGKLGLMLRSLVGFVHFLVSIYLPGLKWKRTPTTRDLEYIDLFYKKLLALGHLNPKRMFIESFLLIQFFSGFNMASTKNGVALFTGASLAFCWTGMSFRLSRAILDFLHDKLDSADVKSVVYYETVNTTHNFFVGKWQGTSYNWDLLQQAERIAEIFYISNYTIFHGRIYLEQGKYRSAEEMADILLSIGRDFDHDYPLALRYFLRTKILVKYHRLHEALTEAEESIAFLRGMQLGTLEFGLHALAARACVLEDDLERAQEYLTEADELATEASLTPSYRGEYLVSSLLLELRRAEVTVAEGRIGPGSRLLRNALVLGRQAVSNAAKVASDQTETFRLMGTCHWLIGRRKKAVGWWEKSIRTAQHLGARLELARTYMEVGKRLLEPQGKYPKLSGMSSASYLNKAQALFDEMELEWDLAHLEDVRKASNVETS
ncbi:MAG: AAA family ATPase [Candidatus Marinimicrobia bacterium]|nr:AAA family ATPase [Candidatus Neomarinimicrobiota bacterium]